MKRFIPAYNKLKSLKPKNIFTRRFIIASIFYILLLALYILTNAGASYTATINKVVMIFGHPLPLQTLPGLFTAFSTIVLISFVLFYKKLGFWTSIILLIPRTINLLIGISRFTATSIPGFALTILAYITIILIFSRNQNVEKVEKEHRKEVEEFATEVIGAFANCIDGKDSYTNGHSIRVATYTKMLAKKLGEKPETVSKYYNIALLHDIGKIGIPEAILNKPSKLTEHEYDIMKSHPVRGYEILKDVKIQEALADGAHFHHERYDGKGYPAGLAGENIPWVARIISVADAFDAMSSSRPYREKESMDFIVKELQDCSGTQFDPKVVKAFLDLFNEGAFDYLK